MVWLLGYNSTRCLDFLLSYFVDHLKPSGNCMHRLLSQSFRNLYLCVSCDSYCKQGLFLKKNSKNKLIWSL